MSQLFLHHRLRPFANLHSMRFSQRCLRSYLTRNSRPDILRLHRKGGGRMTSSEGSSWGYQRPGEVAET